MRYWIDRHRSVLITLSIIIIALSVFVASDEGSREWSVPLVLAVGTLLYLFGAYRAWKQNLMAIFWGNALLTLITGSSCILIVLEEGGII